jgi:flagellin-specific chaperone FliS
MSNQNQKQIRQREENIRPISEQIKRDTSRLDADASEKLKKLIQKLYMWIWILLGISALFLIIILLRR